MFSVIFEVNPRATEFNTYLDTEDVEAGARGGGRFRKKDMCCVGKPSVMIFDLNETLIDFQSLNPLFQKTFGGDEQVLREWLGDLILYSMTLTMLGPYRDYWDIGRSVFRMVGGIHKVDVTDEGVEAIWPRRPQRL
jgi:hypothetical protein